MRLRINHTFALLLTVATVSATTANAQARPHPSSDGPRRAELALDYSYVHSNAPPGGCGCINLNGGSATFAWPISHKSFALAGDITVAHAGAISSHNYSLTLAAFTVGGRYSPRMRGGPLQPFGQLLIGAAHSSGTLVSGQSTTTTNAGAAFAANLGGGFDLKATPRFSLRLVEADYLITTFKNGINDHQNDFRLSSGIVLHF